MKERVPICQEKEKNFLCESDWCWRSSTLAFRVLNKEVAVKSKFTIHNVKIEVSLSLCKYQPWCENICIQNTCLESQFWKLYVDSLSCSSVHFTVFSIFVAGVSLHWQLCSSLCRPPNAPLSNRDKKKTCLQRDFFPGNLGPKSVTLGGPVVLLACGSRGRDNLLAWGKLFASPYELKSRIWVWEEYDHFERFYRVCRLDRFLSNFSKTS